MARSKALVPVETVTHSILVLRGHRVILDRDLAALYGVSTKRLNEAVKRNAARFPEDFMFRLSAEEAAVLRSQFATSKTPARDGVKIKVRAALDGHGLDTVAIQV